jgi:hypothetical protein
MAFRFRPVFFSGFWPPHIYYLVCQWGSPSGITRCLLILTKMFESSPLPTPDQLFFTQRTEKPNALLLGFLDAAVLL